MMMIMIDGDDDDDDNKKLLMLLLPFSTVKTLNDFFLKFLTTTTIL